ncbi:hypothetical protein M406DRAFT_52985 [Cryphonectria parasitica EP155]|uniref:FAS1 domain-containing protein n=1 Tax=Cryphonectria parasitica (strain ATCC 38755 / EP155) TaxID=660469 RepID=A0A9P4XT24_CRYP1|nr:uncharacterized protein M406DRAFT_52985 [Cryphonectria parasitica EP155]KAF3760346.1 hypothetical protein M406DRAFT_52985 [Cryphonectria parasitica EP155]
MQVKYFASFVLAGLASAQSLQEIISQNSNLTTLAGLLNQTGLLAELGNASNITVLAPSNDAFSVFLNESATMAQMQSDPGLVQAVLEYHVLAGTIRSTDITTTPAFAKTMLTHMTYTNVTGGQVVKAQAVDSNVVFTSGLLMRSNVTQADIGFDGGVVHIIDSVLTVPQNDSATAVAANLTALAGALTQAGLVATVDAAMDVTIFAPSNAGFAAISNLVGSLSMEQLTQILTYHVVSGTVGYSTTLMNGMTIPTLDGNATVTITVDNGTIFVNSAKVVTADVLLNNGVAHVIDK